MRKGFRGELRIGLSRRGVALLRVGGWWRRKVECVADASLEEDDFASADRLAERLGQVIAQAQCKNLLATVVLADDLVRLFMVTPPVNAASLQDCRSAAEMRFRSLYGEGGSDWQLQADWDASHPFLACAVPNVLLTALCQFGNTHRLTLIEIVPQFAAAWNRWRTGLTGSGWFGVASGNQLTLGAIEAGRLSAVRTAAVPPDGWREQGWLPGHLGREALRLNLPMPQQLQMCGDVPGEWSEQHFGSLACMRLDAVQRAGNKASASGAVSLAYCGVPR